MIIPEENIKKFLAIYKPEQRVLKNANLDYPKIHGDFLIGRTYYTLSPLKHATDIEIQLCLNQLAYVGLAETIRLSLDPLFKDIIFEDLQKEGMYIIESKKRFKKRISPNKYIAGDMTIKSKIQRRGIILLNADFQFENNSCFGNLELVILNRETKESK